MEKFIEHTNTMFTVRTILGLLDWDKSTIMPKGVGEQRGNQLAFLSTYLHELETKPDYLKLLDDLSVSPKLNDTEKRAVQNARYFAQRKSRIPKALVEEQAKLSVSANESWIEARKTNQFSTFLPELKKTIELNKKLGQCLSENGQSPYEALLAEFEPHFPVQQLKGVFEGLKKELVPLVQAKANKIRGQEEGGLTPVSEAKQKQLGEWLLKWMGFDFDRGRLDISTHPFCGGGGSDTRMTTRYNENFWRMSFYGTMHECGHGLYEQGLEKLVKLKALRETPSMGMHESQSRFWENQIGRSHAFVEVLYKQAKDGLGVTLAPNADALYKEVNTAERSYIRVEADELTYNLHIMLRFELEEGVISGKYSAEDLPELWWKKIEEYLGLPKKEDSIGVLQDIHWSMGAFGYFPSYTIGNLIAAQLLDALATTVNWKADVKASKTSDILSWLRTNVHAHGAGYSTLDLVKKVTGNELSHHAFIRLMKEKFV